MKAFYLFLFLLPVTAVAQGQMQLELQNYETGISPGFRFDLKIGDKSYLTSKFGFYLSPAKKYNDTYSQQDKGFIYSLGYTRTNIFIKNLSTHLRANLWQISNQKDYNAVVCGILPPCPPPKTQTKFERQLLFQPTIGLEYTLRLRSSFFLKPHLSIGYSLESTFSKDGDDLSEFYRSINERSSNKVSFTGEGLIFVGGINLGYNF